MYFDAAWSRDSVCFTVVEVPRAELLDARPEVSGGDSCIEDLETLPDRRQGVDIHRSYEPEICLHAEGVEYETAEVDGIVSRLRCRSAVIPREAECCTRCAEQGSRRLCGVTAHSAEIDTQGYDEIKLNGCRESQQ